MAKYAENSEVSSERSRMEIERTLKRYGADQFMYGTRTDVALIAFRATGRNVRFQLPLPNPNQPEFTHRPYDGKPGQSRRSPQQAEKAYEQAIRQRWRALALCIKAKLEAVEAGITQFDEEFYAHIVLPGGKTIYEETSDAVRVAYESGKMPPLLPHLT